MNYTHTIFTDRLGDLNKLAKRADKSLSVTRSGSDYYLIKGTGPMDFIQLAHVRAAHPMTHDWAMETIAQIIRDRAGA